MIASLSRLRRLQQRAGRPGRCPLDHGREGVHVIAAVVGAGEGPPQDLEARFPPCELCGTRHGCLLVVEEVILVAPGPDGRPVQVNEEPTP
jgi:hypothetical protein